MQKLQPLRRQFTAEKVDARRVAARSWEAGDESYHLRTMATNNKIGRFTERMEALTCLWKARAQ